MNSYYKLYFITFVNSKFTTMNETDFIKRLEQIFQNYGLTASSFADKINVQRSSISHLLSGRNKPSLDFILKIIEVYPEIDMLWLCTGKGKNFMTEEPQLQYQDSIFFEEDLFKQDLENKTEVHIDIEKKIPEKEDLHESKIDHEKDLLTNDVMDKVLFFYKDGTFMEFKKRM